MNRFHSLARRFVLTLAAALTCASPFASFADSPAADHADSHADVQAGRALFMRNGCYECHGIFGQGSISTGPALAPHPLPLAAMQAYVHAPKGQMPPFSEKILSNADIARIHQYLESIPAGPPAASIALLSDGVTPQQVSAPSAPSASSASPAAVTSAHGASIYTANCAACHGPGGEGGVGPALAGIAAKLSLDGVEARIREPSGGIMPKLYPKPLDAADVQDVARYVMSLK